MIEGPRAKPNHPSFRPWVPAPTLIKVVAASALLAVLIVIVIETGRPNRLTAPASPISASPIPDAPDTSFVKTEAIRPTPAPDPVPDPVAGWPRGYAFKIEGHSLACRC